TVHLSTLPRTAEVGMFVASPQGMRATKIAGGVAVTGYPTLGTATFDQVSVQPATPQQLPGWSQEPISETAGGQQASGSAGGQKAGGPAGGDDTEAGGTFTVKGTGDVAGYGIASFQGGGDDDMVVLSLSGIQLGLLAVVTLGVLFAAGEYKTGIVRTTFAASPRRGRVLAAKAIVVGTAGFGARAGGGFPPFFLAPPGRGPPPSPAPPG